MSTNFMRNIQGSWTNQTSPRRKITNIVIEPWCPELLKDKMDKDGYIHAVIEIDFWDLIDCNSIDDLNDLAENRILHESCMGLGALMEDISYKVVGFKPVEDGSGAVYVEVTGYVKEIVEAWEEDAKAVMEGYTMTTSESKK